MPAVPLHPAISNSDAAAILGAGDPPGKFLVRNRPGSSTEFILSVTFGGKVTHHKIAPNASGDLCVNAKSYGTPAKTLDDFIPQLTADPPPAGWPVRLEQPFPPAAGGGAAASGASDAPENIKNIKAWVHDAMSNAKSEALFKTADSSGEGVFMVRRRGTEFPKGFVLSVIYKGKPSHHLIHVAPEKSKINKATLKGSSSVHDVIRELRKKHKFWPVPLTDSILPDIAGEKKAAEDASKARQTAKSNAAAADDAAASAAAAAAAEAEAVSTADAEAAKEAESAAAAATAAADAASAAAKTAQAAQRHSVQMEVFHDEEDGGMMGFGDSDGEDNAPPATASSGSGSSAAATHDAELSALEARVAAIQAQRKAAQSKPPASAPTGNAAPAAAAEPQKSKPKPKKKKKSHAQIMAELAGETAAEEEAAAAEEVDNGLKPAKVAPKKGGKKSHAEMMAELAAEGHFEDEESKKKGNANPDDSDDERDDGFSTHMDADVQFSGVHSDRTTHFESFEGGAKKKKSEPNWKRAAREKKEHAEYEVLQARKSEEHAEWIVSENIRVAEEAKRAHMLASRNVSVRAHLDSVREAHAKPVVLPKIRRRAAEEAPPEPELEIPEPVQKGDPPPAPFEVFRSTETSVPSHHTPECPVCEKKVSSTGRVVKVPLGTFHNWCFKCVCCREQLKEDTYATHMDKEFCENCYNDQFELYKNKWIPIEIPEGFDC